MILDDGFLGGWASCSFPPARTLLLGMAREIFSVIHSELERMNKRDETNPEQMHNSNSTILSIEGTAQGGKK
jgi:hypothetical protein